MKGSRSRKTTQLTLFSSMKRITKTDISNKGKAQIGKRTSVVPNVAGLFPPSASYFSASKVSNLSCIDDADGFVEDVPIDGSSLKKQSDPNVYCTLVPLVEVNAIGVGSEELVSDDSNEGVLSNEGTEKQEIIRGVVKPQILDCRNSTSQAIDVEDRSESVKAEPFEMPQTDYVKFELCICTCHFARVNSCCVDAPESVHTASSRDSLLDATEDEASVHMRGTVRDEAFRNSSVVIGKINTRIVGRKFSTDAVCEEGMQLAFVRNADNPKDSNAVKVRATEWTLLFLTCLELQVWDVNFRFFHAFHTLVKLQQIFDNALSRKETSSLLHVLGMFSPSSEEESYPLKLRNS